MRLLLCLVLSFACACSAAAPAFQPGLAPGPMPVGLKVVHQYDFSRDFQGGIDPVTGRPIEGEPSRPVQTLVWYPAGSATSGAAMRYGDYLQLTGTELRFERTAAEARAAADAFIRGEYVSESGPEQARQVLEAPVRARRDAAASKGRFPVVIYAPSLSAPAAENSDLCEYLASHGYIVIASPSVGRRSRAMPIDLDGAQTQADDIAFLVAYARTLPYADSSRIAIAGYSWGGLANLLAASRDSRIKALVTLDGSVRSYPELVTAAKYVTPERATAPMLFVAGRPAAAEDLAGSGKSAGSFLDEMKHADFYKLTMFPMEHFAFSSTYLRFASQARFNQYARPEVNRAYGWTLNYVRRFLDAYLKDDRAARAVLDAPLSAQGIPAHAATMEVRLAAAAPPSRERLAAALARQDFRDALAVYRAMYGKADQPGLPESELNAWGYALLQGGEAGPARAIFTLATELYPASANAHDSLAEACERSGDKAGAIRHYRRASALAPNSENARKRLQALGAADVPSDSAARPDQAS